VLVRTWNLFHGNSSPPRRRAYLDEMLGLVTADDPDVLLLQEVPAFALGRFTAGDVAARPGIGPVPIGAAAGRRLTELHHGLLRSAFSGQGNAIQVSPRLEVIDRKLLTLNPARFRRQAARSLSLGPTARLAWAKERRIAQALRLRTADGQTLTVCNVHCTSAPDRRIPDAELLRAAWFASSTAEPDDVVVLGGDFNVTVDESPVLRSLSGREWGFTAAGPGIDHVLVRGAVATEERAWPPADREYEGMLLSDHAPVEVVVS
jgi:endonuclease/exonuclease/phosphatase family metal-dependent hydrolase